MRNESDFSYSARRLISSSNLIVKTCRYKSENLTVLMVNYHAQQSRFYDDMMRGECLIDIQIWGNE